MNEQCDVISKAVEDYKTLEQDMRFKYESSTKAQDALYTLRMRATEEQQKALDALSDTFKADVVEMEDMTRRFTEMKNKLESLDVDLYDSLQSLFRAYESLHSALGKEMTLSLMYHQGDSTLISSVLHEGVDEDASPFQGDELAPFSPPALETDASPFQGDHGLKSAPF